MTNTKNYIVTVSLTLMVRAESKEQAHNRIIDMLPITLGRGTSLDPRGTVKVHGGVLEKKWTYSIEEEEEA